MKRDREAHGWTLRQFEARVEIHFSTLSSIENGRRPFTENLAIKCDECFPERRGWYLIYYDESRSWTPPGFRDWPEYEDKATLMQLWIPCTVHGLLQTENYARGLLVTNRDATPDVIANRLANRMARQQRVMYRDDPPLVRCVVDHAALYRLVESPEVMAEQCSHLLDVGQRPNVTLQVMPSVAHPATASEVIVTDTAAYTEDVMSGRAYTDEQSVGRLTRLFDSLRAECYRASESAAVIRKAVEIWTGESQATAARTADRA